MKKNMLCTVAVLILMMGMTALFGCGNLVSNKSSEGSFSAENAEDFSEENQRSELHYEEEKDCFLFSLTKEQAANLKKLSYSILCKSEEEEGYYFCVVDGLPLKADEDGKVKIDKDQSVCTIYDEEEKENIPITRMSYGEKGHWESKFTFFCDPDIDFDLYVTEYLISSVLDVDMEKTDGKDGLSFELSQRFQCGVSPDSLDYARKNDFWFGIIQKNYMPTVGKNEQVLPYEKWQTSGSFFQRFHGITNESLNIRKQDLAKLQGTYVMQAVLELKDGTLVASDLMPLKNTGKADGTDNKEKEETKVTKILENEEGKFTFTIAAEEATFCGYEGTAREIHLPDTVENYPVTVIDNHAFDQPTETILSISLPDTVETIKSNAISGYYIQEIDLGEGIKNIESQAIRYCGYLKELSIPASVKQIGVNPIAYCSAMEKIAVDENNENYKAENNMLLSKDGKTIYYVPQALSGKCVMPDTVTEVASHGFSGCKNITEVVFSKNLKKINADAFSDTSLKSIELPDSLEYLGPRTFVEDQEYESDVEISEIKIGKNLKWISGAAFSRYCCRKFVVDRENPYYKSLENGMIVTKDGKFLALCPAGLSGEVTVPEGVTNIALRCFDQNGAMDQYIQNAEGITRLILPKTLEYMDCMYLPKHLKFLCVNSDLKEWNNIDECSCEVEIKGSSNYTVDEHGVYNKDKTILYHAGEDEDESTTYTIPDSVEKIEANALVNLYQTTEKIVFPAKLTLKGMEAEEVAEILSEFQVLKSFEVRDGNSYFSTEDGVLFDKEKKSLICYPAGKTDEEYSVPKGVEGISKNGLFDIYGIKEHLKKLTIPETVTAFHLEDRAGYGEFPSVDWLSELVIDRKNPLFAVENNVIYTKEEKSVVGLVSKNLKSIEFPKGIRSIAKNAIFLQDFIEGTEIYLPEGLESIEEGNFIGFEAKDQWDKIYVHLPKSVTHISEESFVNSPGIELYVAKDSYGEKFAKEHNINYLIESIE